MLLRKVRMYGIAVIICLIIAPLDLDAARSAELVTSAIPDRDEAGAMVPGR
jgi:hypothetical protein